MGSYGEPAPLSKPGQPPAHIAKVAAQRVDTLECAPRSVELAELLVASAEMVIHADQLPLVLPRELQRPREDLFCGPVLALQEEALAEFLIDLEALDTAPVRRLELGDRLIDQPHILERESQVVMTRGVAPADRLRDL